MDEIMFRAFTDELYEIEKDAAVGELALKGGKVVGRFLKNRFVPKGATLTGLKKGLKTPVRSTGKVMKEGWKGMTWRGKGKYTKYLPVGDKSITAGFLASSVPGAVAKEDPTGRGRSRLRRIGETAAANAAYVAGVGLGLPLIPAIVGSYAAETATGKTIGAAEKALGKKKRPVRVNVPSY